MTLGSEDSQKHSEGKPDTQKAIGKKKESFYSTIPGILTGIAAIIATIASVIAAFTEATTTRSSAPISVNQSLEEVEEVKGQVRDVTQELGELKIQIETFSQIPEASAVAVQLEQINSAIKEIQSKQSNLEKVILDDPVKALEMPLLREELENTKDSQEQSFVALKQNIDQVYDLNKWLLGAMAISIITLAMSNFLKEKSNSD